MLEGDEWGEERMVIGKDFNVGEGSRDEDMTEKLWWSLTKQRNLHFSWREKSTRVLVQSLYSVQIFLQKYIQNYRMKIKIYLQSIFVNVTSWVHPVEKTWHGGDWMKRSTPNQNTCKKSLQKLCKTARWQKVNHDKAREHRTLNKTIDCKVVPGDMFTGSLSVMGEES